MQQELDSNTRTDKDEKVSYAVIMRRLMGSIRDYRGVTIATPLLVLGEVVSRQTSSTRSR